MLFDFDPASLGVLSEDFFILRTTRKTISVGGLLGRGCNLCSEAPELGIVRRHLALERGGLARLPVLHKLADLVPIITLPISGL